MKFHFDSRFSMNFAIFRRNVDEILPEFRISQKWSGNDKMSRDFEKNVTRGSSCRLVDYFSTVSEWLRLQFDQWTTIFNGFRMASTTVPTSGLVDYDFKKFPRCARLSLCKKPLYSIHFCKKAFNFFPRCARLSLYKKLLQLHFFL